MQSIDNFDDDFQEDEERVDALLCIKLEQCDKIDAVTSNSQEPSSSDSVSTSDSNNMSTQDPSLASTWTGYKLVKDNIDKNIHPSFQRHDHQTNIVMFCS